jgi:hypothetical protein
MRIYILSEHEGEGARGTGPLFSILDMEKMMNRIARVKGVTAAYAYNTNDKGEAIGSPLMTYIKPERKTRAKSR